MPLADAVSLDAIKAAAASPPGRLVRAHQGGGSVRHSTARSAILCPATVCAPQHTGARMHAAVRSLARV